MISYILGGVPRRSLLPLLLAVGCAAQAPPEQRRPATVVATAGPEATAALPSTPLTAPSVRGQSDFPPSALTGLATSIRELVIAALEGRPLPAHPPTEPIRDPAKLVRLKSPLPPVAELEFVVFALEIEIVVVDPPRTPAPGNSHENNSITGLAFLSRTGLKVGSLETSSEDKAPPLPPWLSGAAGFGREVHAALRGGRVSTLLLGEAERPVIGNDALFREVMEENPTREKIGELERLAQRSAEPLGYELDDVGLLARDRGGDLYAFELDFDEHDGQVVLDSAPLVRAERIEVERHDKPPAVPVE